MGATPPPLSYRPARARQALRITSRAREGRAEQRHAAELAEAEAARCSQRRALLDLARTAQGLAQENAALNARLVALQARGEGTWGTHVLFGCTVLFGKLEAHPH